MSSASRGSRTPLLYAVIVMLLVLAGVGWWLWRPSPDTASPTVGQSPSPTPAETSPAAEEDEPPEPEVSPSPEEDLADLATLEGYAAVDDPAQDVADAAGVPPPEPEPAADLRQVELEGDGDSLTVTFHVHERVPIMTDSLVWSLDIFMPEVDDGQEEAADGDDEEPEGADEERTPDEEQEGEEDEPVEGALPHDLVYTVTIQQSGQERMTAIMDWGSSAQTSLEDDPEVEEGTISVTVPAEELERLDGPFEWQALGQLDGVYEDYAPDSGRAGFPEAEASPTPSPTPTETEDEAD